MKLYVLCSYGDGLNDPDVSTDYQELYDFPPIINPKAQMYSEPPDFRAAHFLQQNPEKPEFSFSLLDRHILFAIINLQLWR